MTHLGITLHEVVAYGLGLATLPAVAGAVLAFESVPGQGLWAKRPLVVNRDFWGVRLPGKRAKVWCQRCDWSVTGKASETTPAIRQHRNEHLGEAYPSPSLIDDWPIEATIRYRNVPYKEENR